MIRYHPVLGSMDQLELGKEDRLKGGGTKISYLVSVGEVSVEDSEGEKKSRRASNKCHCWHRGTAQDGRFVSSTSP